MKYHITLLAQMPPQLYGVDVGLSAIRLTSIAFLSNCYLRYAQRKLPQKGRKVHIRSVEFKPQRSNRL
jgi:hypothetical protein